MCVFNCMGHDSNGFEWVICERDCICACLDGDLIMSVCSGVGPMTSEVP